MDERKIPAEGVITGFGRINGRQVAVYAQDFAALGGTYGERGRGIAIDRDENIYITGRTYSDDFKTVSAYQETILYTGPDAFVAKMNAQGTDLIFHTWLQNF